MPQAFNMENICWPLVLSLPIPVRKKQNKRPANERENMATKDKIILGTRELPRLIYNGIDNEWWELDFFHIQPDFFDSLKLLTLVLCIPYSEVDGNVDELPWHIQLSGQNWDDDILPGLDAKRLQEVMRKSVCTFAGMSSVIRQKEDPQEATSAQPLFTEVFFDKEGIHVSRNDEVNWGLIMQFFDTISPPLLDLEPRDFGIYLAITSAMYQAQMAAEDAGYDSIFDIIGSYIPTPAQLRDWLLIPEPAGVEIGVEEAEARLEAVEHKLLQATAELTGLLFGS